MAPVWSKFRAPGKGLPIPHLSAILLIILAMASGCFYRQFVRKPYPRWGEEILIGRPGSAPPLPMRVMRTNEEADACLLIVHGMNEYIGRYADIASHFVRRFIVAGVDLYGHGLSNPLLRQADHALSGGAKEQEVSEAFLSQIPLRNLDRMRQDLGLAMRQLITVCDGQGATEKPVFILSHSLGSLVAASWLLQTQNDEGKRVKGIVLLGPAFSVTRLPGWRGLVANPLINLSFFAEEHFLHAKGEPFPLLVMNQAISIPAVILFDGLLEILSWPGLRQLFTPATPDWVVEYLTNWEEERARHRADGYIIRRSLLRYVKGVEKEIVRFRRRMAEFATPYFLIYSGRDPITPAWGNEDFARATMTKHPDNELLPLPDLNYHEHLFSAPPFRDELLQRIDHWLEKRLASVESRSDLPP